MKVLLVDIDGLRPDVYTTALEGGLLPHLSLLVGGTQGRKSVQIPALAPAPSITFCSQASLFTGGHPAQHGIPGNQFYDRFGSHSQGVPRHYAFDVGDTLSVDDAVRVFTDGLASDCLIMPTLYERFSDWGWRSLVGGNMYARGAGTWIKPSLVELARFTKGKDMFGMQAEDFDRRILDGVIEALQAEGLPQVLTLYFMGLDHESHLQGPEAQLDYLTNSLDPMVGELWQVIVESGSKLPVVSIFSDHGQVRVPPDDRHSLRLAFPFERELGHLFDALGLDVHDFPGEDPDCDAVVASNGGLAQVYLQNRRGRWADPPLFERDVLPVGRAFWDAHHTGKYASELEGALAGVLVRDAGREGWYAPYRALRTDGECVPLDEWFGDKARGPDVYADPVHRLANLSGPYSGDLVLISNYARGFYFGGPVTGVHGGLHPGDSGATLVYAFPGEEPGRAAAFGAAVRARIQARCQAEGGRQPSTADMLTGLLAVVGPDQQD